MRLIKIATVVSTIHFEIRTLPDPIKVKPMCSSFNLISSMFDVFKIHFKGND